MLRYRLLGIAAMMLGDCGPAESLVTVPLQAPYTTEDPTGVYPESRTANLQGESHRAFILEKREFLLGEPIIVELRAWPRTSTEISQNIGGADRMHGRDNTFAFIMRGPDGQWLEGAQPGTAHGGLVGVVTTTMEDPIQIYNAVQRWCVISTPGEYDLYCFYRESKTTPATQSSKDAPSEGIHPARPCMPEAVQVWLHEIDRETIEEIKSRVPSSDLEAALPYWDARRAMANLVGSAHDVAHFRLTIRLAKESEQQTMVTDWLRRIDEARSKNEVVENRVQNRLGALLESVYFEQHPCWLPTLAAWEGDGTPEYLNGMYVGLLLNPHLEATRVALSYPDDALAYWIFVKPPGLAANLKSIADSDPDAKMRARAATWLFNIAPSGPRK